MYKFFHFCQHISRYFFLSVVFCLFLLSFTHSLFLSQEQYELVHRAIAQLFEKQLLLLESPTNSELTDGMVSSNSSILTDMLKICPACEPCDSNSSYTYCMNISSMSEIVDIERRLLESQEKRVGGKTICVRVCVKEGGQMAKGQKQRLTSCLQGRRFDIMLP